MSMNASHEIRKGKDKTFSVVSPAFKTKKFGKGRLLKKYLKMVEGFLGLEGKKLTHIESLIFLG